MQVPDPLLSVKNKDDATSSITMGSGGNDILTITEDGFYVRGQKVPVDENEGKAVFKAFKQFLNEWALRRDY